MDAVIHGDCLDELKKLPDNSVDLVLTSPPYDSAREYKGNLAWDFEKTASELTRIIKPNGVIVWNVADQTKDFCESLTSFKQAISFVENHQCLLVDTIVYAKNNFPAPYPNIKRYAHCFEYVFVLAKTKSFTFNPLKDRPNNNAGKRSVSSSRNVDGTMRKLPSSITPATSIRTNVWTYTTGWRHSYTDEIVKGHPAVMHIQLAKDVISSFSNPRDVVLDPFLGSGTTALAAKMLNRQYIGIEREKDYVEIAEARLKSINPLPLVA